MKKVILLVLAFSLLLVVSCSKGNSSGVLTLTLSTPDPDGSSITDAAREFAKQVYENSEGKIDIKVYPNGTLYGGDPNAGIKQLESGGLDMLVLTASLYANFNPEFTILSVPYLFDNMEVYLDYINSSYGEGLLDSLDSLGIDGLAFWSRSFRKMTTSVRPINSPEDLKGVKLRVLNNSLWVEYFGAAGAVTTPMAFSEVYSALQLNTVDGQENPIDIPWSSKFFEVQKYLSHTDHITDAWIVGFSKKKFASLTPEQQEIIESTAIAMQEWKYEYDLKMDKEIEGKLIEAGMQVNTLTPENKKKFADISISLYPTFKKLVKNDELFDGTVEMLKQ